MLPQHPGLSRGKSAGHLHLYLCRAGVRHLVSSGILALDRRLPGCGSSRPAVKTGSDLQPGFNVWHKLWHIFIAHIAFCILAYSGVESVLQTAGLVRSWREISKAYLFLALTVGLVTPLVAALALSAPIDFTCMKAT